MIYNYDCLEGLRGLSNESIDLLVTDPPYGIGFMGKDWDRALSDKQIWRECLRVLRAGSFAFVMSIPRADCLSRMIISLEDAGFQVNFTPIFWAYASGFPKAQNIGKAVDKRLGAEREVVGIKVTPSGQEYPRGYEIRDTPVPFERSNGLETKPSTPQAKALDGSYGGFQSKPAVEVIIVAMKPLSEKTFVDQALKNRKGITWLDDGRIPYDADNEPDSGDSYYAKRGLSYPNVETVRASIYGNPNIRPSKITLSRGRFPANLLVSDDVLNDGRVTKSGHMEGKHIAPNSYGGFNTPTETKTYPDAGSFSRYFDLDKWAQKTFPFLIVPKASKREKNRGCEDLPEQHATALQFNADDSFKGRRSNNVQNRNYHPTVKPLKLMSYLITLGSREGDVVLDPFLGSGTTALACKMLGRECIGYEIDEVYYNIALKRVNSILT